VKEPDQFDVIVIGSDFAGAVTACRLAEAGLHVCILERGRRFDPGQDFPVYPKPIDPNVPSDAPEDGRDVVQPDVSRMFWKLGKGVWDLRDLDDVLVGQAAGYGGGSLIYANVHLRPPKDTFDDRWRIDGCADGKQPYHERGQLDPYFDLAAKMLEVTPLPHWYADIPKRVQLKRAASDLNRWQKDERSDVEEKVDEPYLRTISTPLAVNFGKEPGGSDEEKPKGSDDEPRGVCDLKGNCCLGCKQGAKNTLDLNYLYRAEEAGAEVRTLAEVIWIERPSQNGRRFRVEYHDHREGGATKQADANYVFLCAGAVNTTELLMRCHEARKLTLTGHGLGTRFHPNQDALSAVFDCDEPQELDRGPTITSTLLYDREPKDNEPTARWRLAFSNASFAPVFGSKLTTGTDSGVTAEVASPAYVVSGSFQEGNATGEIMLSKLKGNFDKGQELFVDTVAWGQADANPHKVRHWFFVQDGGFPVDVEPALGVFRSPLWLGRNAFREEKRPPERKVADPDAHDPDAHEPDAHDYVEHAAASQQVGFATLPIEALTNLISGLTRGTPEHGMGEVSEFGAQRLYRLSDAQPKKKDEGKGDEPKQDEPKGPWKLLPTQLDDALEKLKQRALDTVGLATEGIISSFLEDAASSVSKELYAGLGSIARTSDGLPSVLKQRGKINIAQLDDIKKLDLARGGLRLGVQLLWGSQSGLARAIGDQLWEPTFTGRGKLAEAGVDLLTRLLDYRLGNGRAAMLLSFGLDSMPGRLQLDLPAEPKLGSELLGQKSGSRAYVVGTILDEGTSFGSGTAAGRLVVAGVTAPFEEGEILFAGRKKVGSVESDEPVVDGTLANLLRPKSAAPDLGFRVLRFKPATPCGTVPPALSARLRAKLPEAIDTPERGVQERVLRDIASAWDGELRTDPLWTFFDRRITVHAQGGCPMGPEDRAVTKPTGEVYGCEGLYVMDAAAFPGPVGSNPSATIAAIAEYKVAKFIESSAEKESKFLNPSALEGALEHLQKERGEAVTWVDDDRRELLDPLGDLPSNSSSVEPAHKPVGIEFTERMEGAIGTIDGEGRQPIQTELTVRIDDLADYVARHARGVDVPIPIIKGTLTIGKETEWNLEPHKSYLEVMARPGLDTTGNEIRTIKYHLVTQNGRRIFKGEKTIRDDPGFDAWEDTTRLDIAEFNEKDEEIPGSKGELLLPAQAFFDMQLPSFKADTDDPARQIWAMATFGRFFFGHLAAVYLPELDRLGGLASNLMRRGHG
jgi:choline dehydrogenase-like flavoprotein